MAQVVGAYLSAAGNLAGAVVEELIDRKDQITQGRSSDRMVRDRPTWF